MPGPHGCAAMPERSHERAHMAVTLITVAIMVGNWFDEWVGAASFDLFHLHAAPVSV